MPPRPWQPRVGSFSEAAHGPAACPGSVDAGCARVCPLCCSCSATEQNRPHHRAQRHRTTRQHQEVHSGRAWGNSVVSGSALVLVVCAPAGSLRPHLAAALARTICLPAASSRRQQLVPFATAHSLAHHKAGAAGPKPLAAAPDVPSLPNPSPSRAPPQGTIADGAAVVPISAQLKYNVDVVCEYIVRKIPVPVR